MTTTTDRAERPAVGLEVGAKRWPYAAAHPDAWGLPWKGTVLATNDPRAWEGTMAFPSRLPSQSEVDSHVVGYTFEGRAPVLWDFGSSGLKSFWEPIHALRPYSEDLAAWDLERAEAIERQRVGQAEWEAQEAARRLALSGPPSGVRRVA